MASAAAAVVAMRRSGPLMPLLSSAVLWLSWCVLIGNLANHLPAGLLNRPRGATDSDSAAAALRIHERRLRIRHWKAWIPDAGNALPGGVRKASLARRDPLALQRLLIETRRAELVHWAIWPAWLVTLLWLPPAGVAVNLLFATLFNLPCLLLQRYTRIRLLLMLRRRRLQLTVPASPPRG
ncbi:MAG: hypothetical protein RLZZ219_1632 [Cyanobacteriota bacterium]